MERHGAALRRAIRDAAADLASGRGAGEPKPRPEPTPTALERRRAEARAQRQAAYGEAVRMRGNGATLADIAAALGIAPRTLATWLAAGHAPLRSRKPGGSILDPFRSHLETRYAEGCRNARLLWRELRALGFEGRPTIVRTWIGRWNKARPDVPGSAVPSGPRWTPPSAHAVTRMLAYGSEGCPNGHKRTCERLLAQTPELAAAVGVARRLIRMLRGETKEPLADVLDAMKGTALAGLAASLERDKPAVQAALDTPWTTSPVEGQVNRLKLIKRTMYGRAGFPLLRSRVLQAA